MSKKWKKKQEAGFLDLRKKKESLPCEKQSGDRDHLYPSPLCDAAVFAFLQEANAFANVYESPQYTLNKITKIKQCLTFNPVCQFGLITSVSKTSLWLRNEAVALLRSGLCLDLVPFMTKRGGVLTSILK